MSLLSTLVCWHSVRGYVYHILRSIYSAHRFNWYLLVRKLIVYLHFFTSWGSQIIDISPIEACMAVSVQTCMCETTESADVPCNWDHYKNGLYIYKVTTVQVPNLWLGMLKWKKKYSSEKLLSLFGIYCMTLEFLVLTKQVYRWENL